MENANLKTEKPDPDENDRHGLELKIAKNELLIAQTNERIAELDEKLKTNREAFRETNKLTFDALKHLTTLSAGSIVLMVAFLERLFPNRREWIALIGCALVCFIICIISSMLCLMHLASFITIHALQTKEKTPMANYISRTMNVGIWTFVVGMMCLLIFAFKNLY